MTRAYPALLALLLSGCYSWQKVDNPSVETRWVKTELETLRSVPGCETSIACAIRFPKVGVCVVLAATKLEDTLGLIVKHEKEHCGGKDH